MSNLLGKDAIPTACPGSSTDILATAVEVLARAREGPAATLEILAAVEEVLVTAFEVLATGIVELATAAEALMSRPGNANLKGTSPAQLSGWRFDSQIGSESVRLAW